VSALEGMTDKAAHDAVPTALRTPGLNSKDLGNIGEFWYRGRFGKGSDWSEMGVDAGSLGKSADGMPIPSTKRAPDVIDEQGRIVEVKGGAENVQNSRKSDSGVTQFEDNMQMLGQTMAKDGVEREITGVRYVFVDPKGGAANLECTSSRCQCARRSDQQSCRRAAFQSGSVFCGGGGGASAPSSHGSRFGAVLSGGCSKGSVTPKFSPCRALTTASCRYVAGSTPHSRAVSSSV